MHRTIKVGFGLAIVGLVILALATAPDQPAVRWNRLDSHMLESDELYFKNLRRFYYEAESREKAKLEILRLKDRWRSNDGRPNGPHLAIVMNPLHDEAHIMFQWKDSVLTDSLFLEGRAEDEKFQLAVGVQGMDVHREKAALLYHFLAQVEGDIEAGYMQERRFVWESEEERKGVRMVLRDYLKLIGAI